MVDTVATEIMVRINVKMSLNKFSNIKNSKHDIESL